ncbi:NOL1/NOP2/sun family protein [Diplogelasinospora grovesii]|uniref:NOL1/NOP2/sun family protein n=1 Tax=Diplogelasinospora grovesii TaxID=303347 RepID=A0AAN6N4Y5_9PEZI|nr:NOL1/NOP2/sun family protein [Diplogelasinospora grovesii]
MLSLTVLAALVASVAAKDGRTFAVLRHYGKGPLTTCRADPVISPGVPSSHLHTVLGASNFGLNATGESLKQSSCTTALPKNDKSAYWFPTLFFKDPIDGHFEQVDFFYMNVYYFFEGTNDQIKAFPTGLQMVSGNAGLRSAPVTTGQDNLDPSKGPIQPAQVTCPRSNFNPPSWPVGSDGSMAGIQDPNNKGSGMGFPLQDCDGYASPMRMDLHFPSCYNPAAGLTNYKTNMQFPTSTGNGKQDCPAGWIHVPHLFYEVYWDTHKLLPRFQNLIGKESPWVFANGDVTGFSLHGDFIAGWDEPTLQQIIDNCDAGDSGMDKCPGLIGGLNDKSTSCNIQCPVDEVVTGNLTKLPGNNPLAGWSYGTGGGGGSAPAPASSQAAASSSKAAPAASSAPVSGKVSSTTAPAAKSSTTTKAAASVANTKVAVDPIVSADPVSNGAPAPTAVASSAAANPAPGGGASTTTVVDTVTVWQTTTVYGSGSPAPTAPVSSNSTGSDINGIRKMSLYHEAASILTSADSSHGGSLKTKVYGNKSLKSPPAQVYALALESCKWSAVLKEVVEASQLLQSERKITPILAILLVHDLLCSKGIALPASHGLRMSVERHKARLSSEFTRARLRRKCSTIDALRAVVESDHLRHVYGGRVHPRWVRINSLKTMVDEQLDTTFKQLKLEMVPSVSEIVEGRRGVMCLDGQVPNLIAVSPEVDFTKTQAYKNGDIILQDKASCFPAYLLNPRPEEGEVMDTCAAPGNKTTHLASILYERGAELGRVRVHAFEKDKFRAKTLQNMVLKAGGDKMIRVNAGQDFLRVSPDEDKYKGVTALLLDPSCSGSGIVGRDDLPELHLPEAPTASGGNKNDGQNGKKGNDRKRKRNEKDDGNNNFGKQQKKKEEQETVMVDDDGQTTVVSSEQDLKDRIEALASFQLTLLLHAFTFPAARRVTYSTCSVYAGENEHVVLKALRSDVAKKRGWRIMKREDQVRGMREWPVRGDPAACDGDEEVAEACIRTYKDDGRGTMGFFVAGFVRDETDGEDEDGDGPFLRDEEGRIVRDATGMPTLKKRKGAVQQEKMDEDEEDEVDEEWDGFQD